MSLQNTILKLQGDGDENKAREDSQFFFAKHHRSEVKVAQSCLTLCSPVDYTAEKAKATRSSTLAWKNPMGGGAW